MIRELSPDLAKIANEELNENPNQTKDDVQHLKEWILKQPHLKARTDSQWLVAMLRGCKFSLERVKQKLDLYYTLRTTAPDITLRIKPTDPKFIEFFRLGFVVTEALMNVNYYNDSTTVSEKEPLLKRYGKKLRGILPVGYLAEAECSMHLCACIIMVYTVLKISKSIRLLDENGHAIHNFFVARTCIVLPKPKSKLFPRVILIRCGVFDPSTQSVADLMCILYYLVQILVIEDDVATVLGTKIMVDYEGATMNHLVQASPTMLKKMVAVSQDSMPLRLKGSHHFNLPTGVEKIFTLISGFLNEKAKQRLKVHKSYDELSEFIPKEIIPKEYGGNGDSVAEIIEYWVSKFKDYKSWMKDEEQFGTDESKRQGQPVNQDMMGLDGSFRKLDID